VSDVRPAVERLLREAGCHKVRPDKGSHAIRHGPRHKTNFPLPAKIKSRHTANAILKQAGLPKAF